MKKLLLSVAILLSVASFGQGKVLKSFLSTVAYDAPGLTPYVENALAFDSRTAVYKEFQPGKFKASVEITTIFKQGETVCNFSKIALDSPVVNDTTSLSGAFIDQQRFSLPNGEYQMEVMVMDLNNKKQLPFRSEQTVTVDFPNASPSVSDIFFVDSFHKATKQSACTKSGYDFVPRVYPYYSASDQKLTFYAELYNSNKLYSEGKYLVTYHIESYESSAKINNMTFSKRYDVGTASPLLTSIDISTLPSGNYYLVVEMRDRNNALLASSSAFFQRSNPGASYNMQDLSAIDVKNTFVSNIQNVDSLRQYLLYLDPICSETERNYLISLVKTKDANTMKQFLYNFWCARAPQNPRQGWVDYLNAVKRVNASYGTMAYPGYRTDRGYMFLKYGQPDQIVESPNEPGAYPYEIWHYYEVGNQHNKRAVFMAKDDSTNDYHLIHSDIIGELNNPRWRLEIYSRTYGEGYDQGVDQTDYEDMWGKKASDLYDNPR